MHAEAATADLVIVGAGIVGLGAAYAGIRRGLRVVVIDRTDRPVGASIRNFGHLCIGAQGGSAREFADVSREIWLRLAKDAGFWLRESGTLVAAQSDDEIEILQSAAADGDVRMLDADELLQNAPLRRDAIVGGALITPDLQTNPREAISALVAHLGSLGVEFRFRTAVTAVSAKRVETTRGAIDAGVVIVATNHDVDQLLPELAERAGLVRCALDMMRVSVSVPRSLAAPLLTGWSLVRYGRFDAYAATARLRERLHGDHPELAALDLNQMYTQLPDGSLIIGDSHTKAGQPDPFQPEAAFDAFLSEMRGLFDIDRIDVLERWQGIYAAASKPFLIDEPEPGLYVIAATTGIGMTCGLGLAEHTLQNAFTRAPQLAQGGNP
ncbi:TIGR03364 family FAD-dependent oxidoreductase [Microbacterium sp.]|uniref:TIGR03364 family FAD-dependent oxidoreductase n=1 Tax=Microbacterium sp. TaxID=51671 RepID=UPI0026039C82|nr:TIGR03364 family FAD-dependent oxidoreductase [Microbacterium sp.]